MNRIIEQTRPSYGVFSSALGGETSDYVQSAVFVDMKNWNRAVGIAQAYNVVPGQVLTLQLYEATATGGGGSATISGATDTATATASTQRIVLKAEVSAAELTSGYQYVGMRVTTDDTDGTEQIGGVVLQAEGRYNEATPPA